MPSQWGVLVATAFNPIDNSVKITSMTAGDLEAKAKVKARLNFAGTGNA